MRGVAGSQDPPHFGVAGSRGPDACLALRGLRTRGHCGVAGSQDPPLPLRCGVSGPAAPYALQDLRIRCLALQGLRIRL